nr:MAG TPA: hypothetical protein [Caudoviricetes sp.]
MIFLEKVVDKLGALWYTMSIGIADNYPCQSNLIDSCNS